MEKSYLGQRFMSPEEASAIFALQINILPEVADEVTALSEGSIGLVDAIMITMGEKISEEPDVEVSPEFIRETLGVPEDPTGLDQWREEFWGKFKSQNEQVRPEVKL